MDVQINDTDRLQVVLSGLSDRIRNKIIINALKKISNPILIAARSKLWNFQRTGRLYRSLGQKTISNKGVILGARKTGSYKGWHAHLIENGTKERSYISKNGVYHRTGKTRGNKFWSSSIDETMRKSEGEFKTYIVNSMEREVNLLSKKL